MLLSKLISSVQQIRTRFFYKERINDTMQQQSKVDISTVHALLLQKDKHSIVIVV